MNTGEQFVAEARSWLGTPFEFHGRTKGVGVDCCGLVIGCCEQLGLELPEMPPYRKDFYDLTMYEWGWRNLIKQLPTYERKPVAGDLLLMRWPIQPVHLGIYTGNNTVIHAITNGHRMPDKPVLDQAVVETTMTYHMWHRVYAVFTIPSVEETCLAREDRTHCVHWWDGERCCSCGASEMPLKEKIANGMTT